MRISKRIDRRMRVSIGGRLQGKVRRCMGGVTQRDTIAVLIMMDGCMWGVRKERVYMRGKGYDEMCVCVCVREVICRADENVSSGVLPE